MFRNFSLAAAAALFAAPALACDGFEVRDAYARATGAMAQAGAAFMSLHNTGSRDCHVVAVRFNAAARTELHTHQEDDRGVMRMVEIDAGIPLPAEGVRVLDRGGDHVMFLGLTRPFAQGDTIEVTFVFEDGAERTVPVTVDNERQPGGHGHSHSHGHSHGKQD
ncbi:copper chaperone PCu(A)C [Pararhodobacter sp. SW119]|uniref:copper chaperone PCu(A)C n=1 Tax=Pararhodobacter sp. SW119 TaxID=2780075 RepID=UPI001ADF80F7|nr:copper chaperone PCu(A)C [Pararhodobacter sp. SW119]